MYRDDYPKRERDLEHFATIAIRYRATGQLLADMALEPPTDSVGGILAADGEDEGMVTLSTVHSAKGLEWHTVFVLWAADGRFPSLYTVGDDADLEEERRLDVRRGHARQGSCSISRIPSKFMIAASGVILGKPSRFVADVDETLLGADRARRRDE